MTAQSLIRSFGQRIERPLVDRITDLYEHRWGKGPNFHEWRGASQILKHPFRKLGLSVVSPDEAASRFGDIPRLLILGKADCSSMSDWSERRGFTIACMLTGLSWAEIEYAMTHCRSFGCTETAKLWCQFMGLANERANGFLYAGNCQDGSVKIGFSTNPARRAKRLGLDLFHSEPATMLHEWAIHEILLKFRIAPETYRREAFLRFLISDQLQSVSA